MYTIRTNVKDDATVTTQTFERAVKIIDDGVEICKDHNCSPPVFTITSDKWDYIKNMKAYVDKVSGVLVYVPTPKEEPEQDI